MRKPVPLSESLAVTDQPSKSDIGELAALGYRTLINNRLDGEVPFQLSSDDARAEALRHGMDYVHLPVKGSQIRRSDVDAFHRALREHPQPAVAHCQSGFRSFMLWAAGEALAGRRDLGVLVAEGAAAGYDVKSLPDLVARLRDEPAGP